MCKFGQFVLIGIVQDVGDMVVDFQCEGFDEGVVQCCVKLYVKGDVDMGDVQEIVGCYCFDIVVLNGVQIVQQVGVIQCKVMVQYCFVELMCFDQLGEIVKFQWGDEGVFVVWVQFDEVFG